MTEDLNHQTFCSLRRDRFGSFEPLTPNGVSQLVRAAGQRAEVDRTVNPHLFRHSWMTEMLRRGTNAIQLSVIAGAAHEVIGPCYEHINEKDARDALRRALMASDQVHKGAG